METDNRTDYLIIGAGPAGLQLGYFLAKAGRDYLILEAGAAPGGFFKVQPRHRRLISINKVHTGYEDKEINLRWDWNSLLSDDDHMLFRQYSRSYYPNADDMVRYLGDFAEHFGLAIKYNTHVALVAKDSDEFIVRDTNGAVYRGKRLVVATGCSMPYVPEIKGIEHAENYNDVTIDPEQFAGQRVLIIGKGNSGFEVAKGLIGTTALIHMVSPTPVTFAWQSKYLGNLRAINNEILDTYQLKSQNVVLDAKVDKITRRGDELVVSFAYSHADEELEDLVYDRVIACTGFRFDRSIFDPATCQPALTINERFPAQTPEWESVDIPDMYFAGVLMHARDYKKKQSGFIHGFRYNVQALHRIFERKYHQAPWPHMTLPLDVEELTAAIIKRVNVSSALWQQTGFIGDLLVVDKDRKTVRYYPDVPVDYVHHSDFSENEHYYIVMLQFGMDVIRSSPNVFAIERMHKNDFAKAALSAGIHPIIQRYCHDSLIHEHHIIEDIASEWREEVHIAPLAAFLRSQLEPSQSRAREAETVQPMEGL